MADDLTSLNDTGSARPKINILGWCLSAIGLVAVIDDARELRSSLKNWLDSWKGAVERVSDFLFGWIDLWWLDVSPREAHALTIVTILAASEARSNWSVRDRAPSKELNLEFGYLVLGPFASTYLFGVLTAVLIPDPYGIFAAILGGLWLWSMAWNMRSIYDPNLRLPGAKIRLMALVPTMGIALGIVLVDVILFQAGSSA